MSNTKIIAVLIDGYTQKAALKHDNDLRICTICKSEYVGDRFVFYKEDCSMDFYKKLERLVKISPKYQTLTVCCLTCFNILKEEGVDALVFRDKLGLL